MYVVGGESLIDLVSQPVGADGKIHMDALAGGSPYNCAIVVGALTRSAKSCFTPASSCGFKR